MSVDTYLCAYVCVCVRQGVHIPVTVSMCRQGVGSVVCLCVEGPGCSPDFSWQLQWSMSSAEGNKSKPQAKWPYPEDIKRHLGQQQHEQQGDETGYQHVHCAWLSIRTGSTRYF